MNEDIMRMVDAVKAKKCPFCGKDMGNISGADFTGALSWREFQISGLCQDCQDKMFGDEEEQEEPH